MEKHPAKETPFMKPQSSNWTPPSGRNVHVDSFVDTARKQCNNFLSITILLKSVTSTTTKSIPLTNSRKITVSPSKKLTKGVLLCSSTHVITSTIVRIFCQIQQITKTCNQKHKQFMSESKNLISNLHGTCSVFLKNTLPDQPKPAVFYGIQKTHKLPEVIKIVMECRKIIDQTAIDIAIEHNILPPSQPIMSGIGCLTENMSAC